MILQKEHVLTLFYLSIQGDLMKEDEILEWVLELHESTADVIESVDRKTLQVLINDVEHLAVFFCEYIHT